MAKRRLSNFNFEAEGSHIALVHKDQGGPANLHDYALVCKSTQDIKEKDIEKAAEVTVTLSMVDFLCKFFNLWHDDAVVLAAIMGFQGIEESYPESEQFDYKDYLQEKVDAVQVMKSLAMDKGVDDIKKAVGELTPKDYLSVLKCQEVFEKNYEQFAHEKPSVEKAEESSVAKAAQNPSVENNNNGDTMSEFVTKAVHDAAVQEAVEKAKGEVQVELQKALERVEAFEKAAKEAVEKSRKDAIAEVEKDAAKAEELFKSLAAVDDASFAVVVKSLKAKADVLEDSDLFVQKSKAVEVEEKEAENSVATLLKNKYAPKQ